MDRSFVDANRAATQRMRELAARLTDAQLLTPVGPHWTVAVVYAHLAFWERRAMYVLDETQKAGHVAYPDIDIVVNDFSLPLWLAIPPREAVRIGIEQCELANRRLEGYPEDLLEQVHAFNPRWVVRALHRNEHLDEAEAALKS